MEGAFFPPPPPPPPPPLLSPASQGVTDQQKVGDETDGNRYVRKAPERTVVAMLTPIHKLGPAMPSAVIALLSEQWPKYDRLSFSQIGSSCESFPVSLVMQEEGTFHVPIGHVLLSRCVEDAAGLLAESIVVSSKMRGTGLGRRLMELMHEYVRSRGFQTVYLATRDKRDFYSHLGYSICEPVTIASAVTAGEERSSAVSKLKDVFGGSDLKVVWMKKAIE
jgi:N-acetylglutamate synthase-like GNAT family acetyltransferase